MNESQKLLSEIKVSIQKLESTIASKEYDQAFTLAAKAQAQLKLLEPKILRKVK